VGKRFSGAFAAIPAKVENGDKVGYIHALPGVEPWVDL
jgi:hypothetical protein